MSPAFANDILITVCARGGSKGLPNKNILPVCGKPLIAHTLLQAQNWGKASHILLSTDSEEIAAVGKKYGASVPFLRPESLATDSASKLHALHHALTEAELFFQQQFPIILDLDPTSPIRRIEDLDHALEIFLQKKVPVCFSVTECRKNPYFNMVERYPDGKIKLSKSLPASVYRRQDAPKVWDMNASIYVYDRSFLLTRPEHFWNVETEIIPMPPESAFDVDHYRDLVVVEALMQKFELSQ